MIPAIPMKPSYFSSASTPPLQKPLPPKFGMAFVYNLRDDLRNSIIDSLQNAFSPEDLSRITLEDILQALDTVNPKTHIKKPEQSLSESLHLS